jgi:hypothetical protein
MLDDTALERFHHAGYVHVPSAVSQDAVRDMRERIWAQLEEQGADRADPTTWPRSYVSGLQVLRKSDPRPHDSDAVREALDRVFAGVPWRPPEHWGQALITFPTGGPWVIPKGPWHLDHSYVQGRGVSGVNVFLFVDDVEPGGGGTVAIEGSPALVARFVANTPGADSMKHGALNRRFMRSHTWLAELAARERPSDSERFTARDTDLDGLPARVVELTGKPGDVVICHPLLMHSPAPNALPRPRLMRTSRIYPAKERAERSP